MSSKTPSEVAGTAGATVTPAAAARGTGALLLTAAGAGVAGAVFLHGLDVVTGLQRAHPWLLAMLPVLGVAGAWLYRQADPAALGGTRLLIQQSRVPAGRPPFAMAPLILVTTLLTHLGGGSAGREGTALQMGGGWAAGVMRWLRLPPRAATWLLPAGMAAGFAAVFGTPWAAAVFAMEVVRTREGWWRRLVGSLACAWVGHGVAMGCGARHAVLKLSLPSALGEPRWLATAAGCGVAMGLLARCFLVAMDRAQRVVGRLPAWWMGPVVGGALVGLAAWATGERGFLGLGMEPMDGGDPSIIGCLRGDAIAPWAWAAKLAFTVATLATGFRGGEVTPLFFMGATAGHAWGHATGAPSSLMAAAGMASLFAAASRAPWACGIMGWELFGPGALPWVAVACGASVVSAPRDGLYGLPGPKRRGGKEMTTSPVRPQGEE